MRGGLENNGRSVLVGTILSNWAMFKIFVLVIARCSREMNLKEKRSRKYAHANDNDNDDDDIFPDKKRTVHFCDSTDVGALADDLLYIKSTATESIL